MKIKVNGKEHTIEGNPALPALMESLGFPTTGNAIAINGSFVPRSTHPSTAVHEGDEIEVVSPMQGG